MYHIRFWMASDSSVGGYYTADIDSLDILDIAQKFGRGETGEIITLVGVDGKDLEDRSTAGWNSQYREYHRYANNEWV